MMSSAHLHVPRARMGGASHVCRRVNKVESTATQRVLTGISQATLKEGKMLSNKLEPCWVYCCEYANDDNKLVGFRSRKVEAKHAGRPLHAPRRTWPQPAALLPRPLLLLVAVTGALVNPRPCCRCCCSWPWPGRS